MAGQLDTALKNIAKQVVAQLGDSLDTTYSDLKAPIEFVRSEEEGEQEMREAKIYLTPDLIGDNQPTLNDEVKLTYSGSTRVGQITSIDTKQGGQTYLFTLLVRF